MTFLAALGFLALIGIPILIIIYILKPKFQEKKISSTYIWKLSLKYKKRRLPLQWLKSFLLVVQCILCAVLAILIARPAIKKITRIDDYTTAEKVVILDASASMMTVSDGKTRFQRAVEYVNGLADSATPEYPISIITVGNDAEVIVNKSGSPSVAKELLKTQKPSGAKANYREAITLANSYLNANSNAEVILVTDHDFESTGYINLENVARDEWNFAIIDAFDGLNSDEQSDDYGQTILIANLISYNKKVVVKPCVEIVYRKSTTGVNDESSYRTSVVELGEVTVEATTVDGEEKVKQVVFDHQRIRDVIGKRLTSFRSLRFYCLVDGKEVDDAFADDNTFCVYGGENTNFKAQYVFNSEENGDNGSYFLSTAIGSQGNCDIDLINAKIDGHKIKDSGYDIYIYQGWTPAKLPTDGAIWIIQPEIGKNYETLGLGFNTASEITSKGSGKIVQANMSHSLLYGITEVSRPTRGDGVFNYTRYITSNIGQSGSFLTTLVSTPDGSPLIFGGYTPNRIPVIVFSFKMSSTDFGMIWENFPQMVSNMLKYSAKYTLDGYLYNIGDDVVMNVKPNAAKLVLSVGEAENEEKFEYTEFTPTSSLKHSIKRGGVYTITQYDGDNNVIGVPVEFFTRCDEDESNFVQKGGKLVSDEFRPDGSDEKEELLERVSYTDITKWFAIALIALIIIEWGLQYREQY